MRRALTVIPIAVIAVMVVSVPLLVFTESDFEQDLKGLVGYGSDAADCRPTTNASSAWAPAPDLPASRDEMRAGVIDGQVYLVGGADELIDTGGGTTKLSTLANLTRFDPRTGRYTELSPLPRALNHVGVATFGGDLYVAGGYGARVDADTSRELFRYDPDRDEWSRLPPMPSPRAAMAIGVIDDRLILAGGEDNTQELDSSIAYDFRERKWSRLADMPTARGHVGSAVAGGKLYVLGGRDSISDSLDLVARYDPELRRWERLPPLPVPTGGLAGETVLGDVLAVGGGDDREGTVTAAVQRWDASRERWVPGLEMRTARHGHTTAVVGGRLYAFGGSECAYFAATEGVESLRLPR